MSRKDPSAAICPYTSIQNMKAFSYSVLLLLLVPGCVASEKPPRFQTTFRHEVAEPNSTLDLLRRIKSKTTAELMLQPSFYSEAALLQYFGARTIRWRSALGAAGKVGDLYSFSFPADKQQPLSEYSLVLAFAIDFVKGRQRAELRGDLQRSTERVAYKEVVEIFGEGSMPMEGGAPLPPSPHSTRPTATDPHGNESIEIDFSDTAVTKTGIFEFRSDGTLDLFRIRFTAKGGP